MENDEGFFGYGWGSKDKLGACATTKFLGILPNSPDFTRNAMNAVVKNEACYHKINALL